MARRRVKRHTISRVTRKVGTHRRRKRRTTHKKRTSRGKTELHVTIHHKTR
ncbi:hypothetical protein [Clostridium thermobutyricum]|uniref:hypothetical protein n=1 Tax=Clostridium thermobutyricum TaxID=29372 RepID=UPI002941CB8E|nr:hypothetical protein [Clostridium thermobutyricum]